MKSVTTDSETAAQHGLNSSPTNFASSTSASTKVSTADNTSELYSHRKSHDEIDEKCSQERRLSGIRTFILENLSTDAKARYFKEIIDYSIPLNDEQIPEPAKGLPK
ncbi:unnamed protein product, partial [Enterobius vermicularis]|uniref:Uncharacterized protein n=1 Tax=Enterobius vermicularis TaxID=51028 RepID=A0A0N4UY11_ENTVE